MFAWRIQYKFSYVETPRKFIIAKLIDIIGNDEVPSLQIESFGIINLRDVVLSLAVRHIEQTLSFIQHCP